ncbi:hypothetical protein H0H93_015379 [Arthromyces matolae]|nr:hypothetical protein H0H93_015379 [Arthromyces matolae]
MIMKSGFLAVFVIAFAILMKADAVPVRGQATSNNNNPITAQGLPSSSQVSSHSSPDSNASASVLVPNSNHTPASPGTQSNFAQSPEPQSPDQPSPIPGFVISSMADDELQDYIQHNGPTLYENGTNDTGIVYVNNSISYIDLFAVMHAYLSRMGAETEKKRPEIQGLVCQFVKFFGQSTGNKAVDDSYEKLKPLFDERCTEIEAAKPVQHSSQRGPEEVTQPSTNRRRTQ